MSISLIINHSSVRARDAIFRREIISRTDSKSFTGRLAWFRPACAKRARYDKRPINLPQKLALTTRSCCRHPDQLNQKPLA